MNADVGQEPNHMALAEEFLTRAFEVDPDFGIVAGQLGDTTFTLTLEF